MIFLQPHRRFAQGEPEPPWRFRTAEPKRARTAQAARHARFADFTAWPTPLFVAGARPPKLRRVHAFKLEGGRRWREMGDGGENSSKAER